MDILKTKLQIGAKKPFKIIHMSDTHLTHADLRDGERKVKLAEERLPIFPHAEEMLEAADQLAKELGAPILSTGDLIDFVSLKNLERAKEFAETHDLFLAAGNHEYSLYVGEAFEDAAYRNQSLQKVQAAFKNNIRQSARVVEGINFVAIDNGYYLFEEEQLAFLKEEVKKGLPIVLLLHVPFYKEELARQAEDPCTHETIAYIREERLIKAVIAGHIHKDTEGTALGRLPQWTTGCTTLRVFEIS